MENRKKVILIRPLPATLTFKDRKIYVTRVCQVTNETIEFTIPVTDFILWKKANQPIFRVFHYLTGDQREMLISGYTADEWDYLFPDEE